MTDDDAFAATMAPPASVPPEGSPDASSLPEVPPAHFVTDRELARGGMGKIVSADDTRLGRRVALKVLLDPTGDAIGRFEREALITARLQHPGIVPVYEAGRWPSGEPFFAMKLVSGRPLDKVIAEATTLEARLAHLPRVAAAAEAIAFAHSQRIIHRDLKPANVLVGDFGETVVIDWGLAKDLDDTETSADRSPRAATHAKTAKLGPRAEPNSNAPTLTVAGAVMGTPAYMAPEQARGEQLDKRADVFALGAMLYHLLAGVPPYDARTATDVIAAAALGKVVPLVERERRAPPDLVAIVDRAMAQLPVDRYQDAGELAAELQRFLTGQLVAAHRYTAGQRVARFVRRHRAAVTIAALAITGFAAGGSLAVGRVVAARDAAEHALAETKIRKEAAEALVDQVFRDIDTQLRSIGRLDLLSRLGTEVRAYFQTISKIQPPGTAASYDDAIRMAKAIDLIGEAELAQGSPDVAKHTWLQARDELAAVLGDDHGDRVTDLRRQVARFDFELGKIYQQRGDITGATGYFDRSKKEYGELRASNPNDRETLLGNAAALDRLGDLLRNDGKIDQAYENYEAARADREHANSLANGDPAAEVEALSTSHVKLGSVYQARGDSAHAMVEYTGALHQRERLLDRTPDNVDYQEEVLEVRTSIAELQKQLGDDAAAIASYQAALPLTTTLLRRDPTNTTWARQHCLLQAGLGFALLDSGQFKPGLDALDVAITGQRELSARDPKSTTWQVDLSRSYTRSGDGHMYLGELDAGVESYQLALAIRKKLVEQDPKSVPFRRSLAWSYAKLANAYRERGDTAKAVDMHEQALATRRALADESPASSGLKNELADTEIQYGSLLLPTDGKRAGEMIEAGVGRAQTLVDSDPINFDWKDTLTQGLLARADAAKLAGDRKARAAALAAALAVAEPAAKHAGDNAHWPGFLAEIHAGLAETAADGATAAAEWKRAREVLEPLAKSGRLPAQRKALLARVQAHG